MILPGLIGAAAALRRMIALNGLAVNSRAPALQYLGARFAAKAGLTYLHITAGLLFVGLVPLQFAWPLQNRKPRLHQNVGRVLLVAGLVAGAPHFPWC